MVAPHTARRPPDDGDPDGPDRPGPSGRGRIGGLLADLRVRPERRRRTDLVVAVVLVVAALVATVLVLAAGDGARTSLRLASPPLAARAPGPVPTALVEAWRASSPSTATALTVGPAVVTAGPTAEGGGVVSGHDAATGAVGWEYRRPEVPCTVGAGFGDVLAVFATDRPTGTWCSDVTTLDPATGARRPARNTDVRPGTRLLADDGHVTATGRNYLETWRSDLVATVEYGALPTPVQSDPQPRLACAHGSVAVASGLVAVLERCPGETSDRLSVLDADPTNADKPGTRSSVLTGIVGGRLVAAGADRTAVAAPDGTLRTFDADGAPVAAVGLGPLAGPTTDPPGLTAGVRPAGPVLLWWTGTGTVALDPTDLTPRWTLAGSLGPGGAFPTAAPGPGTVVVPVPGGLAVADAATGAVSTTLPVDRSGSDAGSGPVGVAVSGPVVVEQRGTTVVALRPPS